MQLIKSQNWQKINRNEKVNREFMMASLADNTNVRPTTANQRTETKNRLILFRVVQLLQSFFVSFFVNRFKIISFYIVNLILQNTLDRFYNA